MGSRGRWVNWQSASVGLTARVIAIKLVSLARQTGPRPGREMLQQVPGEQREDVERRAAALADAMRAIGIRHEVEGFAELDEAVHQALRALIVHVVVARAVHD